METSVNLHNESKSCYGTSYWPVLNAKTQYMILVVGSEDQTKIKVCFDCLVASHKCFMKNPVNETLLLLQKYIQFNNNGIYVHVKLSYINHD